MPNLDLIRKQLALTPNRNHAEEQRILGMDGVGKWVELFAYIAKREKIDEIYQDQKWREKIKKDLGHDPYGDNRAGDPAGIRGIATENGAHGMGDQHQPF